MPGTSLLPSRYKINGVISTDKTVLQNLETLCSAAGAWLTYDAHDGLWSFVINKAETSVASFDDHNIIGTITLGGTGIKELYNSARVEFPHIDLRDQKDFVKVEIPDSDRNPNEPDNTLNIQYDIFNDPVQAELLARIELRQSRVNQTIQFNTDFSEFGLKAGDVIDVSNTLYDFDQKLFRIISIVESDSDDNIILTITAIEYDSNVYDEEFLTRFARTTSTSIPTQGNIGVPGTPTVNSYFKDSRPRFEVQSTAPTGVIEGMELWYTTDVPPGVTLDENRTYRLVDTQYAQTGNVFAFGDTVSFTVDNLVADDYIVKTRAFNSSTTGPFSTPTSTINYNPVQVTDAVGQNTDILDDSDNALTGLLAANALLYLLSTLFSGNTSTSGSPGVNSGSLYGSFWDLFNTDTGTSGNVATTTGALGQVARIGDSIAKLSVVATAGADTVSSLSTTSLGSSATMYNFDFTPDISGNYKFDAIIDQNGSGAAGGRGNVSPGYWGEDMDWVQVYVILTEGSGTGGTQLLYLTSGGPGAQYWTDFAVTGFTNLTAGQTYNIEFQYQLYTESNPSGTGSFDLSWNVYTVAIS